MTRRLLTILLVSCGAATLVPAHARQARAVGVILEIAGTVYLRPSTTGPEITLDLFKDLARVVYEGQALRAGRGGHVKIKLAKSVEQIYESQGRYELRHPAGTSPSEQKTLDSLNAYARAGGTRGIGSPIFAPAPESAVQLDRLRVEWTPRTSTGTLSLALTTATGRPVWSTGGMSPSSGRLAPAGTTALIAAIRQLQTANAGAGAWTLTLRDDATTIAAVTFRTLTSADESALAARLREWDQDTEPIVRAIGRASEFTERNLLNDAADELDRALALAPQSEGLLRAAISAHDRTGNAPRSRALSEQLKRGAR